MAACTRSSSRRPKSKIRNPGVIALAEMEIGTVRAVDINTEMQDAYLSYAMSVIVSRALPDARDGLKPVQRRILYAMHDMALRPESPH